MYGSGLRQSGGGTARELFGEDAQLATQVPSWHARTSEHKRTSETSKCMETETKLAAPGTNNQDATILAAAPHARAIHSDCPLMRAAISLVDTLPSLLRALEPGTDQGGVSVFLSCSSRGTRPDLKLPRTPLGQLPSFGYPDGSYRFTASDDDDQRLMNDQASNFSLIMRP